MEYLYHPLRQLFIKWLVCVSNSNLSISTCTESVPKTQSLLTFMAKHYQVPTEMTKKQIQVHIKIYESNFTT